VKLRRTSEGLRIQVERESETEEIGRAIAGNVTPDTVIGLVGPLGAGKTRLARAIAEALDVDPQAIASPTFVLIHEYAGRMPVFHFDTYRIGSPAEFEALGAADYFAAGGLCLVEWADRVTGLLPRNAWWVRLELDASDPARREIAIEAPVAVIDRLHAAL